MLSLSFKDEAFWPHCKSFPANSIWLESLNIASFSSHFIFPQIHKEGLGFFIRSSLQYRYSLDSFSKLWMWASLIVNILVRQVSPEKAFIRCFQRWCYIFTFDKVSKKLQSMHEIFRLLTSLLERMRLRILLASKSMLDGSRWQTVWYICYSTNNNEITLWNLFYNGLCMYLSVYLFMTKW